MRAGILHHTKTSLALVAALFRNGALTNTSPHIPSAKEEPSLARTLKPAGYVTAQFGKWRS